MLNGISQNAARQQGKNQPAEQEKYFRAAQSFEVPTTAAWLRVAVRDVHTDQIGTMEIPLPLADAAGAASAAAGGAAAPSK